MEAHSLCLSMILSENRFPPRIGAIPDSGGMLFGIML